MLAAESEVIAVVVHEDDGRERADVRVAFFSASGDARRAEVTERVAEATAARSSPYCSPRQLTSMSAGRASRKSCKEDGSSAVVRPRSLLPSSPDVVVYFSRSAIDLEADLLRELQAGAVASSVGDDASGLPNEQARFGCWLAIRDILSGHEFSFSLPLRKLSQAGFEGVTDA